LRECTGEIIEIFKESEDKYTRIYAYCFYPLSIFKSTPTSNGEGMGRK
jgi:hypothetical protein